MWTTCDTSFWRSLSHALSYFVYSISLKSRNYIKELRLEDTLRFLQASARQKPVSNRWAHFPLFTPLYSCLFVAAFYAMLCSAMLGYGGTYEGKTICGNHS